MRTLAHKVRDDAVEAAPLEVTGAFPYFPMPFSPEAAGAVSPFATELRIVLRRGHLTSVLADLSDKEQAGYMSMTADKGVTSQNLALRNRRPKLKSF